MIWIWVTIFIAAILTLTASIPLFVKKEKTSKPYEEVSTTLSKALVALSSLRKEFLTIKPDSIEFESSYLKVAVILEVFVKKIEKAMNTLLDEKMSLLEKSSLHDAILKDSEDLRQLCLSSLALENISRDNAVSNLAERLYSIGDIDYFSAQENSRLFQSLLEKE